MAAMRSLPEAVGNPLFGLPEIPQRDLPDEPFRPATPATANNDTFHDYEHGAC